jgi:hypothetical protein
VGWAVFETRAGPVEVELGGLVDSNCPREQFLSDFYPTEKKCVDEVHPLVEVFPKHSPIGVGAVVDTHNRLHDSEGLVVYSLPGKLDLGKLKLKPKIGPCGFNAFFHTYRSDGFCMEAGFEAQVAKQKLHFGVGVGAYITTVNGLVPPGELPGIPVQPGPVPTSPSESGATATPTPAGATATPTATPTGTPTPGADAQLLPGTGPAATPTSTVTASPSATATPTSLPTYTEVLIAPPPTATPEAQTTAPATPATPTSASEAPADSTGGRPDIHRRGPTGRPGGPAAGRARAWGRAGRGQPGRPGHPPGRRDLPRRRLRPQPADLALAGRLGGGRRARGREPPDRLPGPRRHGQQRPGQLERLEQAQRRHLGVGLLRGHSERRGVQRPDPALRLSGPLVAAPS